MRDEFSRVMTGSTHQTIYMPDIRRLAIPVPRRDEQQRIVAELRARLPKVDGLIANQEQLVTLLSEKRQVAITEAVTKGLDPSVPMKDSGIEWLGAIPKHWTVRRLKHLGEIRSGIAKGRDAGDRPTEARPYLRVANVQDGWLDLSDVDTLEVTADERRRYALRAGDVLMNEGGDFDKLGRGHVWEEQIAGCIHQNHVFAFRPGGRVDPYWINLATQGAYLRHYFMLRSKQSTNLASISATNLGNAPIAMPPTGEVAEILSSVRAHISRADQALRAVHDQRARLLEYRQALITAAVTGKLNLSAFTGEANHVEPKLSARKAKGDA